MVDISNHPIKNLEDAKRYFKAMGCSDFHISREDPDRCNEYYALRISTETESIWRREKIEESFQNYSSTPRKDAWWAFSQLKRLATNQFDDAKHDDYARLLDLANGFLGKQFHKQIRMVLDAIIGNNNSPAHGGLIEACSKSGYMDLMAGYVDTAKRLIEKADAENIDICFVRGYFCDAIKNLKIEEDRAFLKKLREEDNLAAFEYYLEGAKEGNVFSMRMLAQHYQKGKGCKKSHKDASFWLEAALKE